MAQNELVSEVEAEESAYSTDDYQGLSPDQMMHRRFGDTPIIFSAPHAVKHVRDGETKKSDLYTGGLATVLARQMGATLVASAGHQTVDPMRGDSDHPHKQAILGAKVNGARFLIDLHGMGSETAQKNGCDIGIGLGSIPSAHSGILARAYRQAGKQVGITVKCGFSAFAALKASGVTMFALNKGIYAIQMEHAPSLRYGDDVQKRADTLKLHQVVLAWVVDQLPLLDQLHGGAASLEM